MIALVVVAVVATVMYRTRWGYNIRMIGQNEILKYSGINVPFYIILAQGVGGSLQVWEVLLAW